MAHQGRTGCHTQLNLKERMKQGMNRINAEAVDAHSTITRPNRCDRSPENDGNSESGQFALANGHDRCEGRQRARAMP
jgi:hypothetical protein